MRLRWIALFIVLSVPSFLLWKYVFQSTSSPDTIQGKLITSLNIAGFPNATIEKFSIFNEHILFENISLDAHDFSTISFLQIPLNKSDEIYIKNATLTGELSLSDNKITIAGLQKPVETILDTALKTAQLKKIKAERINLDLSTPYGIIRIEANADIKRTPDGHYKIQALIWAKQKQFTIESNWSGEITNLKTYDLKSEIHSAKFDLSSIQASRASGQLILKNKSNEAEINGHLIAGAFRIFDMPFQNGRLEIKNDNQDVEVTATGHSYSKEQDDDHKIDLSITSNLTQDKHKAVLSSPRLENIIYSLTKNLLPEINQSDLKTHIDSVPAAHSPASLTLTKAPAATTISVDIEQIETELNGTIKSQDKDLLIAMNALKTKTEDLKNILPNVWNKNLDIANGTIDIASNIGLERLQTENPRKVAFNIKANALLQLNGVDVELDDHTKAQALSGRTQIDKLFPIQFAETTSLSAKEVTLLPFIVPNATIQLSATSEKNALKTTRLQSGSWMLNNIIAVDDDQTATIEFNQTQLNQLLPQADTNATISGIFPIKWNRNAPDQIEILSGQVSTDNQGYIKIPLESTSPQFSDQNSQHIEAIKIALTNYNYDFMSLDIALDQTSNIKAILKAKGKNQLSFGERPIDINMNIDTLALEYLPLILTPENFQTNEASENETP